MGRYVFKDVPASRSRTMRAIRHRDTSIELMVRHALFSRGYRYRVNYRQLPGSPDIAFIRRRVAVFLDSEFWHGKDWEAKNPKINSNRGYWVPKIEGNMARDRRVGQALRADGWKVLRFWDQDVRMNLDDVIQKIEKAVAG